MLPVLLYQLPAQHPNRACSVIRDCRQEELQATPTLAQFGATRIPLILTCNNTIGQNSPPSLPQMPVSQKFPLACRPWQVILATVGFRQLEVQRISRCGLSWSMSCCTDTCGGAARATPKICCICASALRHCCEIGCKHVWRSTGDALTKATVGKITIIRGHHCSEAERSYLQAYIMMHVLASMHAVFYRPDRHAPVKI